MADYFIAGAWGREHRIDAQRAAISKYNRQIPQNTMECPKEQKDVKSMSDLALIGKIYFYLYHIFFNTRTKVAKMACNFLINQRYIF